jgi:hypothetical protein
MAGDGVALGLSHERGVEDDLLLNQTPVLLALKQVNLRRDCAPAVDAQAISGEYGFDHKRVIPTSRFRAA